MKRIIITIIFCLSLFSSLAQNGDIEQQFKQKLESVSSKNITISCDFTQTKRVKNIKQPVVSRGQFYYDNNGYMALIYSQPKADRVVMNGETFTVVANGKKLISNGASNPMMAQISYMMQACMSGNISKLGRGWGMNVTKNGDDYQVTLTPTDNRVKKYISGMIMLFDPTNITLNVLRIEERSGGYTEYIFANKRLNQSIDSSYFKVE